MTGDIQSAIVDIIRFAGVALCLCGQAALVRWHREGNYSIGGRIRGLARYQTLTDREALALEFPLREAQEIIALEAGYASWAALKIAVANGPTRTSACRDTSTHARRACDLRCQR